MIIGVIAAITVPLLINEYRMSQYKSALMKAMSVLNQSLIKYQYDEGYDTTCGYVGGTPTGIDVNECKKLYKYFLTHLNITKVCDGYSYKNGCIPKYKGIDTVVASRGESAESAAKNCSGFSESYLMGNKASFVTGDGFIYVPYINDFIQPIFLVDINGQQGPNKWGYDLHVILLTKYNKNKPAKFEITTTCTTTEKGGKNGRDLLYK